jgi:hypothetical protein
MNFVAATPKENPVVVLYWDGGYDAPDHVACTLYQLAPSGLQQIEAVDAYDGRLCGGAYYWRNRGMDLRFGNSPLSD